MEKHISLITYRINGIEFKFKEGIKAGTKFQIKPKIECKMGRNQNNLFVNLSVRINEDISSPVPFDLNVTSFGTFGVIKDADESVLVAEAMDTLYPFVRAAVASMTANCNIPPYILPLINSENAQIEQERKENLN